MHAVRSPATSDARWHPEHHPQAVAETRILLEDDSLSFSRTSRAYCCSRGLSESLSLATLNFVQIARRPRLAVLVDGLRIQQVAGSSPDSRTHI